MIFVAFVLFIPVKAAYIRPELVGTFPGPSASGNYVAALFLFITYELGNYFTGQNILKLY
jgi:hypothetical protein